MQLNAPALKTSAMLLALTAMNTLTVAAAEQGNSAQVDTTAAIKSLEDNLTLPLCQIYSVLTGPFIVAAIVLAVVIGGILKLVGNRNAMTVIFSALTAGIIIFLSGTIVKMVLGNRGAACQLAERLNQGQPSAAPIERANRNGTP